MKVHFKKSFERDLRKIRDPGLLAKIRALIETLETVQALDTVSDLKKLRGAASYYRIRISDYRIGFVIQVDELTLVRILHRREFYRYFP